MLGMLTLFSVALAYPDIETYESYAPEIWIGTDPDSFDGILFEAPMMSGHADNLAKILISGENGSSGYLNLWINFDRDGMFDSDEEWLIRDEFVHPIHPVVGVEDLYATIAKVKVPVDSKIKAGMYQMRVELASLPDGEGDVLHYTQRSYPILTQTYADAVNDIVDFSHESQDVDFTSWTEDVGFSLTELWNTASSNMQKLFTGDFSFITGQTTPQTTESTDAGEEKSSHEAQNAPDYWEPTLAVKVLFIIVLICTCFLTCLNVHSCVQERRKKANDRTLKAEALVSSISSTEEEIGF